MDPFFKEIFDPYKHSDRVEALISAILGKKVKIKEILQHEVMKLIDRYPDFLPIYEEIMAFRKKPEELMMMSSEALQIMDHNTEL